MAANNVWEQHRKCRTFVSTWKLGLVKLRNGGKLFCPQLAGITSVDVALIVDIVIWTWAA